jgi:SAM-dependent methyltransferase
LTRRRPSREWLDDPALPSGEMARSLAEIAKLDRLWGGSAALARWLSGQPGGRDGRRTTVLDLGAGSALPTRSLRRYLQGAGVSASVFAVDVQWRHLIAGARMDGREPLPAIAADALRLPLPDGCVDWAVSTLLLHHFSPDALRALFVEIRRVARRGFVLLDLRRHALPFLFSKLAGPILFDSAVSAHDAPASVRQAYTPRELRRILADAGTHAVVRRLFPFRILVSASRAEALDGT